MALVSVLSGTVVAVWSLSDGDDPLNKAVVTLANAKSTHPPKQWARPQPVRVPLTFAQLTGGGCVPGAEVEFVAYPNASGGDWENFYWESEGHTVRKPKPDYVPPRVGASYLFANGTVMTFDRAGKQIPELQGRHTPELEASVRAESDFSTEFHGFDGKPVAFPQGRVAPPDA